MGRHRVKQAALAEASGLRYATVNALYNGKTERVDFSTLAAVLDGLNTLTGKNYSVADLLAYEENGADETAAVLADHPEILERAQQLRAGTATLIPWQDVKAELSL